MALQPWFGRTPIKVSELLGAGDLDFDAIALFLDDDRARVLEDSDFLYPVSVVWPMGFAWSSVVAQANTLQICLAAGIKNEAFMCLGATVPSQQDEVCGVATDDIVLDAALEDAGVRKNPAKNISLANSIVALGR